MTIRIDDWRLLGKAEQYQPFPDGSRQKVEVELWEAARSVGPLPGNSVNALLGRVNSVPFLQFQPWTLRFVAVRKTHDAPPLYHFAHLPTGWAHCGRAEDYSQVISGKFIRGFELLFTSSAS
jgi:hypothetical protein